MFERSTDSMHIITFCADDQNDIPWWRDEFDLSGPIARRLFWYGIDDFIEAFNGPWRQDNRWLELLDRVKLLDGVECTFDTWDDFWEDFDSRVRSTLCSPGPDGPVRREVLESILRGEDPYPSLTALVDAHSLRTTILQTFAHVVYGEVTRLVLRRMRNGTLVQSALANVIFEFENTNDGNIIEPLEEARSFGWWAIRKVWFPVWKLRRYLWRLSVPKRYAPDGALVTCQNAIAGGDQQLARFSKRSLEYELFRRAVRLKLDKGVFEELVAEAKSLSEELLKK